MNDHTVIMEKALARGIASGSLPRHSYETFKSAPDYLRAERPPYAQLVKRYFSLIWLVLLCGLPLKAAEPKTVAVLLAGSEGGACGFEMANRLVQAGFALNALEHSWSWNKLTNYNVVVVAGLGLANADMTLGHTQERIDLLNRYLEGGGGVLVVGAFGQIGHPQTAPGRVPQTVGADAAL